MIFGIAAGIAFFGAIIGFIWAYVSNVSTKQWWITVGIICAVILVIGSIGIISNLIEMHKSNAEYEYMMDTSKWPESSRSNSSSSTSDEEKNPGKEAGDQVYTDVVLLGSYCNKFLSGEKSYENTLYFAKLYSNNINSYKEVLDAELKKYGSSTNCYEYAEQIVKILENWDESKSKKRNQEKQLKQVLEKLKDEEKLLTAYDKQ